MYVFSGQEKIIYLQSGANPLDVKDLYSSWKQWISSGTNSSYLPAFATIGGDPISQTQNVAPYYFITNGWKIRPYEYSHILVANGNLFVDGGIGNPFVPTTGNYNVVINLSTSNNAVLLTSSEDNTTVLSDLATIKRKINDLTALSL